MTNFQIGDLLVLNINKAQPAEFLGRDPRNGIIISIDRERIGIRWTCYNGTRFKNHYTWRHLEQMIDRKTIEWYPA